MTYVCKNYVKKNNYISLLENKNFIITYIYWLLIPFNRNTNYGNQFLVFNSLISKFIDKIKN